LDRLSCFSKLSLHSQMREYIKDRSIPRKIMNQMTSSENGARKQISDPIRFHLAASFVSKAKRQLRR